MGLTLRYLIDADIAVYAIRRSPIVLERLAAVGGAASMSALVHSQLMQGVARQPNPGAECRLIDALAGVVPIVAYDTAASMAYAAVVAATGFDRHAVLDRMIAAHAISLDATLVTNNTRDFAGIPGLILANWTEPS